jgi:hypothetical protein
MTVPVMARRLIVSVGAFCTRQTFAAPGDLRQRFTVVT